MTSKKEFRLRRIRLANLNVRGALDSSPSGSATLSRQTSISVLELDKARAKILFSQKLFFKPTGPFQADLDFHVYCDTPEGIGSDEAVRLIKEDAYPIYAQVTLILGMITDKILGVPVLIPPGGEEDDIETEIVGGKNAEDKES